MRTSATFGLLLLTVGLAHGAAAQDNAGYGKGFFLRSADGNHELRLGGVFQYRFMGTGLPDADGAEPSLLSGFQYRRIQLDLQGHALTPRWTYRLRLDAANGGTVAPAHAWVAYTFDNGLTLRVGQTKPAFLHEEGVSGSSQLAAERSYTADYFTTDFAQLVQVAYLPAKRLRLTGTLHSGSYSYRTDFNNDLNEFALALRGETALLTDDPTKDWGRLDDFQNWEGAPPVLFVGAALDYEAGERAETGSLPDVLKWTMDLNAKAGPSALFASVTGQRFRLQAPPAAGVHPGLDGTTQWGVVAHATAFPAPDRWAAFARIECLWFDGAYFRLSQGGIQAGSRTLDQDRLRLLTVGVTRHLRKHGAKVTVDLTRAWDAVPVANSGSGLLSAEHGGQAALRTQLQLKF